MSGKCPTPHILPATQSSLKMKNGVNLAEGSYLSVVLTLRTDLLTWLSAQVPLLASPRGGGGCGGGSGPAAAAAAAAAAAVHLAAGHSLPGQLAWPWHR